MMRLLQRRAQKSPVTFTGHIDDRGEIAPLLRAADVTLSPSRAETFGLAVLESLACGTPVVTSESGAGVEVCGTSCGVATTQHAGKMADAVAILLGRDRQSLRQRARARAELFPWTRAAESVLAVHLGHPQQVRGA
jgi:alpha-1,6-mannosyltransferase